jgi:integrase
MQRDVLTLPDTLIAKADALHAEWETLSKARRMYCLRIAVAACQTAILLRTIAVRSTNLREITFRGPCPTLIPALGDRALRIAIPAERVKNGRRLDASVAAGTRPVLQRFQTVYRPLLVADHPYGHHAADSDYLFPGRTMDAPMSATAFAQCFAEGVAAAGLDMSQHMTRHAIAMLLLRAHPESLQLVADWLGDDPETVRAHYAFIDVQAAADDGQAKIADLTRQAKRRAARTKAADTKRSAA